MQQMSIPREASWKLALDIFYRDLRNAEPSIRHLIMWLKIKDDANVDIPHAPKPWEEFITGKVTDAQKLLEMERISAMPLGPNPQPADQLKLIHSLHTMLRENLGWLENEIDVLDREQGDFATLEIFQENLSKTLQELQKSRRFGLLKDITEIDIKGGAIPYDERFTDIQAEVRTITKYDQLTRKIFDTPNPIPAYRLLLIHSLYDAIRDDITWLDKEIEALDREFI